MQNYVSMKETRRILGVSADSLRRWERAGKIKSIRSVGGHRYFLREDIENLGSKFIPKPRRLSKLSKPTFPEIKPEVNKVKPIYLYILIGFVILNIILISVYIYS